MQSPPELDKPPIVEVVCGVRFAPLALSAPLLGLHWAGRRKEYPKTEVRPAIGEYSFTGAELPPQRVWMVSEDGSRLVQIQHDRFYVNWRATGEAYPRFSNIHAAFKAEYEDFRKFCLQEIETSPNPLETELAKISVLRQPKHWSDFADLCAALPALSPAKSLLESDYPNVGVQLNAVQGECVVHCAISTGIDTESGSRVVKIDNRVNRDTTGPKLFEELDASNALLNDLFCRLVPKQEMITRFGGHP